MTFHASQSPILENNRRFDTDPTQQNENMFVHHGPGGWRRTGVATDAKYSVEAAAHKGRGFYEYFCPSPAPVRLRLSLSSSIEGRRMLLSNVDARRMEVRRIV